MSGNRAEYWDKVARVWHLKGYSNRLLAEHWRKTHLATRARWADVTNAGMILKTDLFAEAFGIQQFLFDNAIRKGLEFLDKLEGKRTKYLTGRYVAVKAVKCDGG